MGTSALASLEGMSLAKLTTACPTRAGRGGPGDRLTSPATPLLLTSGSRTRSSLPGVSLQAGVSGGPRHALYNTNTRGHLSCGVCSDVNCLPKKSELPHPDLADVEGLTQQSCST